MLLLYTCTFDSE